MIFARTDAVSDAPDKAVGSSWIFPLMFAAVFCIGALHMQSKVPFPGSFDELQHVSYAAHLQEHGNVLPDFDRHATLSAGDLREWTNAPNYIGHPSPFYLLMAAFLNRDLPPDQAIRAPRLVSAGLLWLGVSLTLAAGWARFRHDWRALLVFCVAISFCPKLLALSSQVTNDSLMFLGSALAYSGVIWSRRRNRLPCLLVGLGLVLALWSKPNAGFVVALWLAAYFLFARKIQKELVLSACFSLSLGALPYAFMLHEHGSPIPVTAERLGMVRHQLTGLKEYVPVFLLTLGRTWSIAQAGGPLTIALFWALVPCAAAAGILARRSSGDDDASIALAGLAAFAAALPVHLWFAATSLGFSIAAASFRYYLPLWPPLVHAICLGTMTAPKVWHRVLFAWIGLVALAAGWLEP